MFLLILCCVMFNCDFLEALMITNGPMNVTVCSGTTAKISCGYAGVTVLSSAVPNWRIIKRNNNGSVISNKTVSINNDTNDGLKFFIILKKKGNVKTADGSYLLVGPVNDTYNNTSYQCIFTINDTIIESTAGTITIIDIPDSPALTYKSTYNEILVSWSPIVSDGVCGPVTYNITVMPSHGMMMMINDTVYNITGLNNNTDYTITVYASNNIGKGEQTTITVKTLPPGGSSSNSDGSNTGITGGIIGGIVAVIITVVIIIVIIVCIVVCCKREDPNDYKNETFQSHELVESNQSCLYHEYDQIKKPKQSIPHQTSASEEQYAVSLNAVNSATEKQQQQQQVPLVEYAEIDNKESSSPQQYNLTSEYDEISDNNSTDRKEQVPTIQYAEVDTKKKNDPTVTQGEAPVMEYAQVDKSKKKISQEKHKAATEYDDTMVENSVTKVKYAELQDLPTNIRRCDAAKGPTTVYTRASNLK